MQLANKSLSTLIGFYIERAIRNGFCSNASGLTNMINKISLGDFNVSFEKSGYIIHWAGNTKPVDNYKGNLIYELGHEDIVELLEIRETEIEDVEKENPAEALTPEPAIDSSLGKEVSEKQYKIKDEEKAEKEIENSQKENEAESENIIDYTKPIHPELPKLNILLGKNVDNGKDVWFNPIKTEPKKLANQHLLIVGKSGAGKSQTTCSVLCELNHQKIPFLILDFQGEYISSVLTNSKDESFMDVTKALEFDPSLGMNINPLELSTDKNKGQKLSFMNNVHQVSGILKEIFSLGDIQHALLRDALKRVYYEKGFSVNDRSTWDNEPPAFQDIWEVLEFMEQNEGMNVRNLKYRIEPLFENNIFVSSDGSFSIDEMLNQNSIVNLSTLPTPEIMKSVARFILQSVYNRMLSEGPSQQIKLYVVIDEAHKLSYDQTLTDLIREARKYGVGFILASQSVRDFAPVVFENMGTKLALQLEGEDAKYMADNFGVTDKLVKNAVMEMLPNQKPLRALIRNNHYEPFVQVDIVPFYEK